MPETAIIVQSLDGGKLCQERAKQALPLLVRQAQAQQSIFYEYQLPSGDKVDVLFTTHGDCIAVETKSAISPPADAWVVHIDPCSKYS